MKRSLLATVLAGTSLLSTHVSQAQTTPIYREVFGNTNTGVNVLLSAVGWHGAWGATATDSSNPSPNNFGISSSIGAPQNLDNINAGGPASTTVNGYLFTSGTGASLNNWIAYQNTYTINTSIYSIQDFSFYCASAALTGGGTPTARVAVEIDGNWYVTTQVFSNNYPVSSGSNVHNPPDGSSTSGAQQVTFTWTTAPSAWNSLTFVPGTSLAMGSVLTSPLPGGNITAFGLYSDQEPGGGNATRRFDTFEIDTSVAPGPPIAGFYGSPTNGPAALPVTFTDTSSGIITNWSWTFGDGGITNLTTAGVAHTYNTPGIYSVTEIVTGPGGSSTNTASNYITVLPPVPPYVSQYVFGVNSNQITLNGQPFKILGLRCANAQISDATTSQLITNLDVFKSYGVNTITVYVMGSRFGDIQGYHPDDSLDPTYAGRLGQIIQAADARGMIVLVGCLYWGTSTANSQLGGWTQTDANRAVSNTVVWLKANNYRNVFVDPDNEGMAQAAKGWSISQEIDAAHSVDKTIMVAYNYTATPPTNADLYIHYSPVVSGKPWLNTETTPNNAPDGGYWNAYSKQTYTSSGGSYYNYSRIGRYTSAMQTDQENQTISGYQNYNGNCLASSWLQCGAYAVNGPFMTPGGLATNQNVDVNIDVLNPDAGILWWLEYIQGRYGAWNPPPPARIVVTQVFFTPDGTNIVLLGTGGSPTGIYEVVTATDLGMSVSNWPAISTNHFDLAGNFAVTNPLSPFDSQRFYSIHVMP